MLIEQEISHDLAELLVLVAQVAEFPRLDPAYIVVLASPSVESCFGDPKLPAYLHGGRAVSHLAQRSDDLRLREFAWPHFRLFLRRLRRGKG